MSVSVLPFDLPGFQIDQVRTVPPILLVDASAINPLAHCPACHTASARVHSRYTRTPRDLPVSEHAVRLRLQVRRFFCTQPHCPKRTFAEPLPAVLPFRAQRTVRLARTLEVLAFALGGEGAARVSTPLHMPLSASTFLRIIRRAPLPPITPPQVVGVDDFALRRGRTYGMIIVDLERRRPIDLLPDRTATTLASWLRTYPGIDVIARDRSTEYARGAADGAPHSRQVLDRWHLLVNLREAVERVLTYHHARLQQMPLPPASPVPPPSLRPQRFRSRTPHEQTRHDLSRSERHARYEAVRRLVAAGLSQRAIARDLQLSRTTVRQFAAAEVFPERARQRPRSSLLDPFLSYLQRRWREGDATGSQLWREIQARGYPGARRHVLRWVQHQREKPAQPSVRAPLVQEPPIVGCALQLPAPRHLVWVFVRPPAELDDENRATLARVQQDAAMRQVYQLVQQFQRMVRLRDTRELSDWFL